MKRFTLIVSTALILLMGSNAYSSDIKVDRLGNKIIVLNDGYFRVIAILTEQGIVLIDTHKSNEDMQRCKKIIENEFKTDKFRYVINSHEDLEHILGNSLFNSSVNITHEGFKIGVENFKKLLVEFDKKNSEVLSKLEKCDSTSEEYKTLKQEAARNKMYCDGFRTAQLIKPDITFSDRMVLHFDSLTVNIIYYGLGHGHSVFVYIPEERFLFSSTCNHHMPNMFSTLKFSDKYTDVDRSISVLSEFINAKDTLKYIVPCHGEYLSNNDLKDIYQYYKTMWDGISKAKSESKSLEYIKSEFALDKRFNSYKSFAVITEDQIKQHNTNIGLIWEYLAKKEN
jgi:glyoxylase-like metal-dependent hydrolase (beta-lactamase superfamily II)